MSSTEYMSDSRTGKELQRSATHPRLHYKTHINPTTTTDTMNGVPAVKKCAATVKELSMQMLCRPATKRPVTRNKFQTRYVGFMQKNDK